MARRGAVFNHAFGLQSRIVPRLNEPYSRAHGSAHRARGYNRIAYPTVGSDNETSGNCVMGNVPLLMLLSAIWLAPQPCCLASSMNMPPRVPPAKFSAAPVHIPAVHTLAHANRDVHPNTRPPVLPALEDGLFPLCECRLFHRTVQAIVVRRDDIPIESKTRKSGKILASKATRTTRRFKENYPAIFGREPPFFAPFREFS